MVREVDSWLEASLASALGGVVEAIVYPLRHGVKLLLLAVKLWRERERETNISITMPLQCISIYLHEVLDCEEEEEEEED